jgi:hypothetical protein
MSSPPSPVSSTASETVVCQVVDPTTLHYLIFEDLLKAPFWLDITHVLVTDWIQFSYAPPASLFDRPKTPFSALSLSDGLRSLQRVQPHLRFVWSLPSPGGKFYMHARIVRYGSYYLESLDQVLAPYPCDGLMMDADFVESLASAYRGFDTLHSLVAKMTVSIWLSVTGTLVPNHAMLLFHERFLVDLYVIQSFGHVHYGPVQVTTHGLYFPMEPKPDNLVKTTDALVTHLQKEWVVPITKMVVWLDTSGIDYTLHKGNMVKFEVIPLKTINRLRYTVQDKPLDNSGELRYDDHLIYYDSPHIQRDKLRIAMFELSGVVMGPLDRDVCYMHPASLVYQATSLVARP